VDFGLPSADCALLAVHLGSDAQIVVFLTMESVLPFLLLGFLFSQVALTRFQPVESCSSFSPLPKAALFKGKDVTKPL
jgi:hypothetical protein